jgi:predicted ATPase
MIKSVEIEHYKSIHDLRLDLGKLVVLVGPNATGKSNFIEALRLPRDAVEQGLDRAVSDRHGIDSIRQWSPSKPYLTTVKVEVESARGRGFLSFSLASNRGNHSVRREEARWESRLPEIMEYRRDHQGSVELCLDGEKSMFRARQPEELFLTQIEARSFSGLRRAISDFEAYAIYPNVLRNPQTSSSDRRLSPSGENLTSVFKRLTKSKAKAHVAAKNEILSAMREVMPSLESIRIRSISGLLWPEFVIREKRGKTHYFNVAQISDGTLRVLGLLTALYHPFRPRTIALEEPEQTIHPGALALLTEAFEDVSEQSQIVITTHSPDLLNSLKDPHCVLAVDMSNGITSIGPLDATQRKAVLDRLFSLGELMTAEGLHQ